MKKMFLAIVAAVVILVSANFAFADVKVNQETDVDVRTNVDVKTNVTATGGKATVVNSQERELLGVTNMAPMGGVVVNLPNGEKHKRWGKGKFQFIAMNAKMRSTLIETNDKVARARNGREWKEIDKAVTLQPMIVRTGQPLGESDLIRWYGFGNYEIKGLTETNIVGYLIVSDNEAIKMEKTIPAVFYAGVMHPFMQEWGANVAVEVDEYFWSKAESTSVGGSASLGGSSLIGCLTGIFGGLGFSGGKGKSSEEVASGRMFLLLRVCDNQPPPKEYVPPQERDCDPSSIYAKIEELKRKVKACTRWCMNNLRLRSKLGEAYIDLYQCTGDRKHLSSAIEQFQIAERNYLKGYDIKANQTEANQLIAQDYYYWAGCINVLNGPNAADQFATEKRVEKIPQF